MGKSETHVEYKDYYKLLGVDRKASQEDISKAFKKQARKHHPDLNPGDEQAETRFKEINEAYEVLKDPEKRKLYDSLGPNWQQGQNFQPPPGFSGHGSGRRHAGGFGGGFGGGGEDFSDFFEFIFGGGMGGAQGGGRFTSGGGGGGFEDLFGGSFSRGARQRRGSDAEAVLDLTLEEAYRGGSKSVTLQEQGVGPEGQAQHQAKTLNVNIPAGVKDGQRIRLTGQGSPGAGGGPSGDLLLRVRIRPHHLFKVEDRNVILDLPLAPWEAALGSKVMVPTLDGRVELNLPAGSDSGKKMRLKGRGLGQGKNKGDMLVRVMIKAPKADSDEAKELWDRIKEASADFSPRDF
jgi:curved DNA-binding protein